jgi:hypothetical protein
MVELREITSGLLFPEGPVALADGSVLVVEIARRCLTRVRPDGAKEIVATPGGGPNGAAIGPDGKCYATTVASSSRRTRVTACARRARPGTTRAGGSSGSSRMTMCSSGFRSIALAASQAARAAAMSRSRSWAPR